MEENNANVLIQINNVQVFRLLNNQRTKVCEGNLNIGCIVDQNVYFLNVGDFYYTLQKQTVFFFAKFETQRTLIFPHIEQGYTGIVIPQHDENNSKLDTILLSTVSLLDGSEVLQNFEMKQSIDTHCQQVFVNSLVDDSKVVHYINVGGNYLKQGFSWLGGKVATGVNMTGEFINQKINPAEQKKEVSVETKQKFENIKNSTQQTMNVAGTFLKQVLSPVVAYTNNVIDSTSKKIDEGDNNVLKKTKEIMKATNNAMSNAFTGLVQGSKDVANSFSSNTRQIIEKKYGDDVTNTFMGKNEQNQEEVKQQQQQQQDQSQQQQIQNNQNSQQIQQPQQNNQQVINKENNNTTTDESFQQNNSNNNLVNPDEDKQKLIPKNN